MKNKITKVFKAVLHPSLMFYILFSKAGKYISSFLVNQAYHLQSQMDINQKSIWYKPEFISENGGFLIKNDPIKREICSLEPWDNTRRDMLILFLRTIVVNNVVGDLVELGVYKGNTAKLIHHFLPERKLFLFDTFAGFTNKSVSEENEKTGFKISSGHFSDTSIESVKENIKPNENVIFHPGFFPENLPDKLDKMVFSFVHLDADLYEPTYKALEIFYSKMSKGGLIVIHDYNSWPGARKAVDLFFRDKAETPIPLPDKSGSVLIVKQ